VVAVFSAAVDAGDLVGDPQFLANAFLHLVRAMDMTPASDGVSRLVELCLVAPFHAERGQLGPRSLCGRRGSSGPTSMGCRSPLGAASAPASDRRFAGLRVRREA
jgi:hypothetical protein